jgi:hypothetical protein
MKAAEYQTAHSTGMTISFTCGLKWSTLNIHIIFPLSPALSRRERGY